MKTLVASFATALLLGGSTLVYAQQPKDPAPGGGGQSPAAQGAERPGAAEKGAEQRGAQEKEPDRARQAQDKQQDRGQQRARDNQERGKQVQDKQQQDRNQQRAQDKQERDKQAQDKQQQDRSQQRAQDKQERDKQAQDKQQQDRSQQRAQDKQERDKQAQDKQPAGTTAQGAERAQPVQLSGEQRDRIRNEFRQARTNVRHYTNVNINVTVGRRLPRDWTYREVPQYIVEVAPRFRGHRFVWVENRYCIVDPATYEIVAFVDDDSGVVHTSSGQVAGWTGRDGRDLTNARCEASWSEADRRRIIEEVEVRRPDRLPDIRVGINLPGDIELKVFPSRLRTQFRPLDECRYVPISDDAIAVVEPDTRKVVEILERR